MSQEINDKFQHFKEMCVSRSIKRNIYIFPQTDPWLRGDLALTNTYTLQFKKKKKKNHVFKQNLEMWL